MAQDICYTHRLLMAHSAAQNGHYTCGRHALSTTAWLREVKKAFGGRKPRRRQHPPPPPPETCTENTGCCEVCAYPILLETFLSGAEDLPDDHCVCITRMGAFVKSPSQRNHLIATLLRKKNLRHLYGLVRFGKWTLTHRFTQDLLAMMKSDESDQEKTDQDDNDSFLAELLGLAPLTEADTARILAVSPFNIHRYLRNAPIVNSLDVMKQAAAGVGKQVTDIYFNAARTRYISVRVAQYLADCFDAEYLTEAQYKSFSGLHWRFCDCKGWTICMS